MVKETKIEAYVEGGKANPGPPLGPALGPAGVNVAQVIQKINEKTASFGGMKVPVKVYVNPKTKEFRIEVGTPPTAELLKKQIGVEKLSKNPKEEQVEATFENIVTVAKAKQDAIGSKNLKNAVLVVLGSCVSSGVRVDGKDPREVQKLVKKGQYDAQLGA